MERKAFGIDILLNYTQMVVHLIGLKNTWKKFCKKALARKELDASCKKYRFQNNTTEEILFSSFQEAVQ